MSPAVNLYLMIRFVSGVGCVLFCQMRFLESASCMQTGLGSSIYKSISLRKGGISVEMHILLANIGAQIHYFRSPVSLFYATINEGSQAKNCHFKQGAIAAMAFSVSRAYL